MRTFKELLVEKLKISNVNSAPDCEYVDSLAPGSREKAEAFLEFMKEKYDDLFDDYRILRTNNVALGKIKEIGSGMYDGSSFTMYLTDPNEYLIRRISPGFGGGHPAKFVQGFKTLEETINKFDSLLKKRGYLK
jgi:hypothetical protein